MSITKLLVANRGEIGCRIIKTCKKLGIKTVSVYSEADRHSLHTKYADEAYFIGPSPPHLSYLNMNKILDIAKKTKANALHPGYGFLSESHEFADICQQNGINFVGPPSSAIKSMGLKNLSKKIMEEANVPIIPGYHKESQDINVLKEAATKIGFPVMIKAVRGGGGKGMRISQSIEDFEEMLNAAKRESKKAFNDDEMILEKYIVNPRHIEVQIFGDKHGNYVYLWERDCSIQRRHQKVLEEAPAPNIKPETRIKIGEAAVKAARAVNYVGAGTVEFVMDREENFYFMEMNTRLQVEHPVSESITNVDFVEWQLRVAQGEVLPIKNQKDIPFNGHAFEARIYAEDCSNPAVMLPSAGKIQLLDIPKSADLFNLSPDYIRVDKAIKQGQEISVFYDPMIAKLITWGSDRKEALNKMKVALREFKVLGIPSNIDFLKRICEHPDVESGILDTGFITENIQNLSPVCKAHDEAEYNAMISVLLNELKSLENNTIDPFYSAKFNTQTGVNFIRNELEIKSKISKLSNEILVNLSGNSVYKFFVHSLERSKENSKIFSFSVENIDSGKIKKFKINQIDDRKYEIEDQSEDLSILVEIPMNTIEKSTSLLQEATKNPLQGESPMPGIIEKILVKVGDKVSKNQALVTVIAMKMEYTIRASIDGTIENIFIKEGENVSKGQVLTKMAE